MKGRQQWSMNYLIEEASTPWTLQTPLYIILHFIPNAYHSAQGFGRKRNPERQAGENK